VELKLTQLYAPAEKAIIDVSTAGEAARFSGVLEGVRAEATPAIDVEAGSTGIPLIDVTLRYLGL
jgi:hypothetical protein